MEFDLLSNDIGGIGILNGKAVVGGHGTEFEMDFTTWIGYFT